MAKITFIILAHEHADQIVEQARLLTSFDAHASAVIHYDLNSANAQFNKLKAEFANNPRIHLVKDRVRCGWGDFSLVDATVRALRLIRDKQIDCDRVMLVSGACLPIKPLAELSEFLDLHAGTEFIESYDSSWIKGGMRTERYEYWHFFNQQRNPALFKAHYHLQRRFWPKRRFPRGLEPRWGSQWWCLSWSVCQQILDFIRERPLTYFFFSTTWIPDEMFFQTLAYHFVPKDRLASRSLTFFHFNDWGKPFVFLDDHAGLLAELPFFFARKISNRAIGLRERLKSTALQPAPAQPLEIDLTTPYDFAYKQRLAELPRAEPGREVLFQHEIPGDVRQVPGSVDKGAGLISSLTDTVRRYLASFRAGRELKQLVNRTADIRTGDILLVTCLQNDTTRLPFFLDYYRRLGVRHFLAVCNGTATENLDWAKSQPDVSLWQGTAELATPEPVMRWFNYLLNRHGSGHLCVTVNPDEYLVYPLMETRSLADLGEYLRTEKREALQTVVLDAYRENASGIAQAGQEETPFDAFPYFDQQGYIQTARSGAPPLVQGGPIMRASTPEQAPLLNRFPVVWWNSKFHFTNEMLDLEPIRPPRLEDLSNPVVSGALFRFPNMGDPGATPYRPGLSVRYHSTEQLIRLGLICRGNWL